MGYCGFNMVGGALWVRYFEWSIGRALGVEDCGWGILGGHGGWGFVDVG